MRIEFDTTETTENDVGALIALLVTLYPDAAEHIITNEHADAARVFAPPPFVEASTDAAQVFASPFANGAAAPAGSTVIPTSGPVAAAQPQSSVTGCPVDNTGLPFDARIHAVGADKLGVLTAAGAWRAKRKVDPAVVASVTTELRAALGAPAAPQAPPPPPPPAPPAPIAPVEAGIPPAAAVPPAPPPPPPALPVSATPVSPPSPVPAAPSPAPSTTDTPFVALMKAVTAGQTANPPTITQAIVNEALAGCGLASLRDLNTRIDLIPLFRALAGLDA